MDDGSSAGFNDIPRYWLHDGCDTDLALNVQQKKLPASSGPTCAHNYDLERVFSATDRAGNAMHHVQTVHVRDTRDPVVELARSGVVMCLFPADGMYLAVKKLSSGGGFLDVIDNCSDRTKVKVSFVRCTASPPLPASGKADCVYHASSDTLFVRAATNDASDETSSSSGGGGHRPRDVGAQQGPHAVSVQRQPPPQVHR